MTHAVRLGVRVPRCLILALRGGLCRREGVLFSELYVAYVAAAVRGVLGMME